MFTLLMFSYDVGWTGGNEKSTCGSRWIFLWTGSNRTVVAFRAWYITYDKFKAEAHIPYTKSYTAFLPWGMAEQEIS